MTTTLEQPVKEIVNLLNDIAETLKKPKIEKITFTIVEASEFSGFNHWKIRELVDKVNTDFPYFKVGNKTLIDKAMLEIWIEKISKEHRTI